ncbi:hypothetical protein ASF44_00795 [Pseudorhodoferax sp. Leaf274]|nr:hypothetical protein ASF44_00795 [Pseudorhodoferax sp. Leaf274]
MGPPAGFATRVVKPAKRWADKNKLVWSAPPPAGWSGRLKDYWRNCLDDLHDGYGATCAYLAVYTHRSLQDTSVDHFEPKSKAPLCKSYDWSNFRLACRPMNTNKDEFQDVLDPFLLPPELFILNLLSGRVQINHRVAPVGTPLHKQAQHTIGRDRLKLNAGPFRDLRLRFIDEYFANRQRPGPRALQEARDLLRLQSPFIWHEVTRQGL